MARTIARGCPWAVVDLRRRRAIPSGSDLAQVVSGKTVQGHELQVKDSLLPADLHACHILFISASEKKRLPNLLAALKGSTTLTVADMENFTGSGGMIQFVAEDGRVRFVINVGAASGAAAESQLEIIVTRANRSPAAERSASN